MAAELRRTDTTDMTTTTSTFTVRGFKLRTRSNRRYVAVAVRPAPVTTESGTYVAFADVRKRSDNLDTLRRFQRSYGWETGAYVVIIDTVSGEEI